MEKEDKSHSINVKLEGDNWYFVEPQNDLRVFPEDLGMEPNKMTNEDYNKKMKTIVKGILYPGGLGDTCLDALIAGKENPRYNAVKMILNSFVSPEKISKLEDLGVL